MPKIELLTSSSVSATLLLMADVCLYDLKDPVSWSVIDVEGRIKGQGVSKKVPVFIDGLSPASTYTFTSVIGTLTFSTAACSGRIDAAEYGLDEESPNNVKAFTLAIDAVPKGGTLIVPRGRFLTSPIFLKSDMTLHLSAGSEIAAIADRTDWPIFPSHDSAGRMIGTWEGLPEPSFASVVNAIDCRALTITGTGTIDGGGDRGDWWFWPKETRNGARRPRTLFMAHCQGVTLSGFKVRNSPSWTVHPSHCSDLLATAMVIENPPDSPNTDGFNPESCVDTQIKGLRISVGDDCIAVKAGKRGAGPNTHLAPTKNLEISNCLMERGHGAVVMGSEMSGDITDVTIQRCAFEGTDRGLRIKTRRGRGGCVERIVLDQVQMENVATPIAINAFYFCDPDGRSAAVQSREPATVDDTTPQVRDITVRNVIALDVHHAPISCLGLPEAAFYGITIEGFQVSYAKHAVPGVPLMADHVKAVRHAGILTEFATVSGSLTLLDPMELETC